MTPNELTFRVTTDDEELQAMEVTLAVLSALPDDGQRRVLAFLQDRHDTGVL